MRVPSASKERWWSAAVIWMAALMLATFAQQGMAQDDDLPGRVGRVAEFAGQLLLSPQDRPGDWEPIGINYPITSGINLWVSSEGRAEVDYGGGQFRLGGDTNVHVARLDDLELALFIAQGRVIIRVRVQDPGEATRIDTPNTQVTLMRPGLYRVEVAPDQQATTLVVREGEANIALAGEARQLLPGEAVSVAGADPVIADVRFAQGVDGFDTWSANRDRRYEGLRSSAYVSRQMVGAADLDRYGSWQTTPEYGAVWFPTVAAPDWAPYRDGYWANIGGWGPTWVDSAPWGYAPFHYGRWAFISGRWGWCPGGYVARPVWAPALVAWYGGTGWGTSVAGGRPLYGWVPLGWREPYYPGWRRCSFNCWARFNRPHGINVTERQSAPPTRHVNLAAPGGLSAVPATSLVGRAPVRSNLVEVPAQLVSSAPAMRTIPQVRMEQRQAPRVPSGIDNVPPAASTQARAQRVDAAPSGAASRPVVPARAGSFPTPAAAPAVSGARAPATTLQRESTRSAPSTVSGTLPPTSIRPAPSQVQRQPELPASTFAPRRATPPAEIAPQRTQVRAAAPPSPSLAPPAPVAAPPIAPSAVAPVPNARGQPAPGPTGNARGGRPEGNAPESAGGSAVVPRVR